MHRKSNALVNSGDFPQPKKHTNHDNISWGVYCFVPAHSVDEDAIHRTMYTFWISHITAIRKSCASHWQEVWTSTLTLLLPSTSTVITHKVEFYELWLETFNEAAAILITNLEHACNRLCLHKSFTTPQ